MLDLFLRLIDRCIELAKRKEEKNKRFYAEFIAPAFADFEAVHKNYMESFMKYREMLLDEQFTLNSQHPVVNLVMSDSLFSDNIRSKVSDLSRMELHRSVYLFLFAIFEYMQCIINDSYLDATDALLFEHQDLEFLLTHCIIRHDFRKKLVDIFQMSSDEVEKRMCAITILDNLVASMQMNYRVVLREYNNLKKCLLNPV
jgi:hypothetical protein